MVWDYLLLLQEVASEPRLFSILPLIRCFVTLLAVGWVP
jgi:hypothetical protein